MQLFYCLSKFVDQRKSRFGSLPDHLLQICAGKLIHQNTVPVIRAYYIIGFRHGKSAGMGNTGLYQFFPCSPVRNGHRKLFQHDTISHIIY